MEAIGRHLIMELWDCNSNIDSVDAVLNVLREATIACGATVIHEYIHPFHPQGITAVAVISESHILIHTWPEHKYAAVDAFTCGKKVQPEEIMPVLERYFKPGRVQVMEMKRGIVDSRVPV